MIKWAASVAVKIDALALEPESDAIFNFTGSIANRACVEFENRCRRRPKYPSKCDTSRRGWGEMTSQAEVSINLKL